MKSKSCIIVGASHAGTTLACQLRREGWQSSIHLLSNEKDSPYHRPPLSKELLAGKKNLEQILLKPQKVFEDNDIQLLLDTKVTSIDSEAQKVVMSDSSVLHYAKLALCTGARARELPFGKGISNLFYIRTARDVLELRAKIDNEKKAVIIGGGYIGLETAATLAQLGMEVVLLEMADRVLQRVTGEAMSTFMIELHAKRNVLIKTSAHIIDIVNDGTSRVVVCESGDTYQADIVIVGVGIEPNVSIAESAGLSIDNGIRVNEFLQTSNEHIYAVGDCSNHYSPLDQRRIRLESVQNANDQARVAAVNIFGNKQIYDSIPWFWSDQYNIKLQIVGLSTDYDKVVLRGEMGKAEEAGFALFYFKKKRLISAECVNRPKEFMVSKRLIKEGGEVGSQLLSDESIEPAKFIASP
jgi:3-phenylpropionate/trans-cinnamate dioxygenase ferredoxin reductase subunit